MRAAVVLTTLLSSVAWGDALPFEVQNGRGTAGLAFSAQASAAPWSRAIRIVTTDPAATTDGLRIAEPIVVETDAGDAVSLRPRAQAGKQALAPDSWIAIELAGVFARPGVYRGELVLVQPPRQRVVPIQVTVAAATLAAPSLADHGGRAIAVTDPLIGAADTTLVIRIENTGAEPVRLVAALAGIARVDKLDNPAYQLAVDPATIEATPGDDGKAGQADRLGTPRDAAQPAEDGKPGQAANAGQAASAGAAANAGAAASAGAAANAGQQVQPGEVAAFRIALRGADDPGIYAVDVQFRDGDGRHQPYNVKATVYRRQSGWLAALAIALGAVVAWFVRAWVSDGKDRLALRRRLALLIAQVRAIRQAAHSEDVIAAARVFELDLEDRGRDAGSGGKLDALDQIASRAEARLALLREIAAALVELAHVDRDRQAPARKALDTALVAVRIDPGDAAKIKEQRDAVAALVLAAVRRDQLIAAVAELGQQIDAQRRIAGAASTALAAALRAVETQLTAAEALARDGELERLDQLVREARAAVVDAGLTELARLAAGLPPPGVPPTTWTTTKAELTTQIADARQHTEWAKRNAALQQAQRTYFKAAVAGAIDQATRLADAGAHRADELRALAGELTAALALGVDQAAARYPAAIALIAAAAPAPGGIGRGEVGGGEAGGGVGRGEIGFGDGIAAVVGWLPLVISRIIGAGPAAPLPEPARLDRAITSYGFLVGLAVLAIAVASGMKALWIDNLAWGGHSAWLNALLWGAGVQATGDAFTGIIGLRAKLGAPPHS